jgi:hypothetical protein
MSLNGFYVGKFFAGALFARYILFVRAVVQTTRTCSLLCIVFVDCVVLSKKLAFIVQSSVVFWCCFGAGSNRSKKEQTKLGQTRVKEETQALVIVRFRVSR